MSKKIALIAGGSSGLGLEFAKNLGLKGYSLIILGRDREKLDNAIKNISAEGYEITGFQCDITDEERLRRVYDEIQDKFKKIDFLALNAGVVTPKLLANYKDTSVLKHDLEINLWGTILSAYIFLTLVNTGGRILMVSSAFGLMGPAAYSVYSASKAGVINFAESLRKELLCKNISVHVACPGDIDTQQLKEEHKNMPVWFKQNDPRKLMSPDVAAKKILTKCFKDKFLIIISCDILFLVMLNSFLPRRLRDLFLDRLFPLPNKTD